MPPLALALLHSTEGAVAAVADVGCCGCLCCGEVDTVTLIAVGRDQTSLLPVVVLLCAVDAADGGER